MYDDDKSNGIYKRTNPSIGWFLTELVTVSGTVPLFNHEMEAYALVSTAPVCVNYRVATDANLVNVVTSGTVYTSSDIDYTVKVGILLHFHRSILNTYRLMQMVSNLSQGTITGSTSATVPTSVLSVAPRPPLLRMTK